MQLLWMVATLFDHSDADAFLWVNLLEEGLICLNSNPPGAPVANEITPLYWLFLIRCLWNTCPIHMPPPPLLACVSSSLHRYSGLFLYMQCHFSVPGTQATLFSLWNFPLSLPVQSQFLLRSSSSEILHC